MRIIITSPTYKISVRKSKVKAYMMAQIGRGTALASIPPSPRYLLDRTVMPLHLNHLHNPGVQLSGILSLYGHRLLYKYQMFI